MAPGVEKIMVIYTQKQIKAAEKLAVDGGMTFLQLMEQAGSACSKIIQRRLRKLPDGVRIVVVCGKGKNGGDGFVIARKLIEVGWNLQVVLAFGRPMEQDSVEMLQKLSSLSVRVIDAIFEEETAGSAIINADMLIDAVFGIGYAARQSQETESLFRLINSTHGFIVSVDVPSGIESDTAKVSGSCVVADMTIAISAFKPCHVLYPAKIYCGEVSAAKIGTEDTFYQQAEFDAYTYTDDEVRKLFPQRNPISNKGDFGRVLSINGSMKYAGAAYFAAMGAVRSGAGLVVAAFPRCAYPAIGSKLTDTPLLPLPCNELGMLAVGAVPELLKQIEECNAVILGCGLGQSADTREIVETVLINAKCPVILDADGINLICGNIDILKKAHAPLVLTPHPGEMARLCGKSIEEVQANRVATAVNFAENYNVTLVLKGANTVVARPGSKQVFINVTGNSGMAKGGSGDLLAGIMAGFAAQRVEDFAATAVYVHGKCGDAAAKRLSQRGMTPDDCLRELAKVLSHFE